MKFTADSNNKKIHSSLKFSFLDGVFASGMVGFTQDYFTPFLLLLGATTQHVSILNALPNLAAALIQLKSVDFAERSGARRKFITRFVFWQAAMLLPMTLIALIGKSSPMAFIIFVTLFSSFGAFVMPAWGSLMSDLVAENKRGEYFGWRNKTLGIMSVVVSFIAGSILQAMHGINIFWGFAVIFAGACIFRLVSWYFLTRMYEPPLEQRQENYFNFLMFIGRIKESNFAKFVLFVALFNFSVNLASPFFAVLMLRDLHFNYWTYTIITITATLTIYLLMSRWGKHADKIGNLKVMRFTAPIIGILPLLWVVNRSPAFLLITQVIAGFAWAGFNLCASNFIYDAAIPEKRPRCIAYFNFLNGLALCLGALLGGFLVDRLPPIFGYQILSICLVSAALRLSVGLLALGKIKEVRAVAKVSDTQLFFSIIGVKPLTL